MTVIIVSGHGDFSLGLLDAFEMVFGADENVKAIPFLRGEGIPQLQEKFQEQLEVFSNDDVLFLVDVFGGTPYNAAAQLIYGQTSCDIVTGVNLPMLLEAAAQKEQGLTAAINAAKDAGMASTKVFSEELAHIRTMNLEEDEL